jgi:hypothetical protein
MSSVVEDHSLPSLSPQSIDRFLPPSSSLWPVRGGSNCRSTTLEKSLLIEEVLVSLDALAGPPPKGGSSLMQVVCDAYPINFAKFFFDTSSVPDY